MGCYSGGPRGTEPLGIYILCGVSPRIWTGLAHLTSGCSGSQGAGSKPLLQGALWSENWATLPRGGEVPRRHGARGAGTASQRSPAPSTRGLWQAQDGKRAARDMTGVVFGHRVLARSSVTVTAAPPPLFTALWPSPVSHRCRNRQQCQDTLRGPPPPPVSSVLHQAASRQHPQGREHVCTQDPSAHTGQRGLARIRYRSSRRHRFREAPEGQLSPRGIPSGSGTTLPKTQESSWGGEPMGA